jgi:hypothetical protein
MLVALASSSVLPTLEGPGCALRLLASLSQAVSMRRRWQPGLHSQPFSALRFPGRPLCGGAINPGKVRIGENGQDKVDFIKAF